MCLQATSGCLTHYYTTSKSFYIGSISKVFTDPICVPSEKGKLGVELLLSVKVRCFQSFFQDDRSFFRHKPPLTTENLRLLCT